MNVAVNPAFENCVTCRDRCEAGIELLQECHDENPQNCMICSYSSCPYYKKSEEGVTNETVTA